jgi:hypothetical protein
MFSTKRFLTLCVCSMILIGFIGCATAPIQLGTTTGKPEIVLNSSKEAAAEYITGVMLSWDYMIKNQTGNVLTFYKSTTYAAPIFPIWDTTPRPGEYRITYNLVNVSEGVRVMVSIIGVKNPNTAYETQEEDLSKGTTSSVNVQNMLNEMKAKLASSAPNNSGKTGNETVKQAQSIPSDATFNVQSIGATVSSGKVLSVIASGPAEKAGIMKDDLITMIDGDAVSNNWMENVQKLVGKTNTSVVVSLKRGDMEMTVPIIRKNP